MEYTKYDVEKNRGKNSVPCRFGYHTWSEKSGIAVCKKCPSWTMFSEETIWPTILIQIVFVVCSIGMIIEYLY